MSALDSLRAQILTGGISGLPAAGAVEPAGATARAALKVTHDSFPWLPADESLIPAAGGVFKEGDPVSGSYRLVTLGPKVS